MRIYDEKQTTDNSKVFKRLHLGATLSCPICGPNRGCNYRGKRRQKSWKVFRKNKHKNLDG